MRTLEPHQSIELFSRLITTLQGAKQGFTLESFYEPDFFQDKMTEFRDREKSIDISPQLFPKLTREAHKSVSSKKPSKNSKQNTQPDFIYHLCKSIREGKIFYCSESVLLKCQNFLNAAGLGKPEYNVIKFENSSEKLTASFFGFFNTKWWVYHLDRNADSLQKDGSYSEEGITRGLLLLHPFGKAELTIHSFNTSGKDSYIGKYESFDALLKISLKIPNSESKDLHIIVASKDGANNRIALGQYHNIGGSIYTGTIFISKILDPLSRADLDRPARFFDFMASESVKKKVPERAWLFLTDRHKNVMRTVRHITNDWNFTRWHKGKNPDNPAYQKHT